MIWKFLAFVPLLATVPGTVWGQTVIYDVVNYGSRTGSGLPSAGIAQGALFAVTGASLGPAAPVQASFPLPTTAGLGGVTVSVKASDGSTLSAILVSVNTNEIDAILPSITALGPATVTVNNSGATASFPFNVVKTAFGIFPGAGVFNVNPDGSTTLNSPGQSAQPGQTILINGTGLGAIPSDETQSGASDIPDANINVWVGTTQAAVISAGRGACCTGIDPNFPIPQGIAAWDVIAVTVPDGVQGCLVPVSVQSGKIVSNAALIAVGPNGGICPEPLLTNGGNPVTLSGVLKTAVVDMTRVEASQNISTLALKSTTDSATAVFVQVDYGPNPVQLPSYPQDLKASVGSCAVTVSRNDRSIPIVPPVNTGPSAPPPVFLDAGSALTITDPGLKQPMKGVQKGIYNATTIVTATTLPGQPTTSSGGPDYLLPGPYTLDNGAGGADIGPFSGTLVNPTPVKWTNMVVGGPVPTSQPLTLTWTGGDPNGVVAIVGSSIGIQGTISYSGFFYCYAFASAGQFTVPAFIMQQIPPTGNAAQGGSGVLQIQAIIGDLITTFPGIDLMSYFSIQAVGTTAVYQ